MVTVLTEVLIRTSALQHITHHYAKKLHSFILLFFLSKNGLKILTLLLLHSNSRFFFGENEAGGMMYFLIPQKSFLAL